MLHHITWMIVSGGEEQLAHFYSIAALISIILRDFIRVYPFYITLYFYSTFSEGNREPESRLFQWTTWENKREIHTHDVCQLKR